MSVSAVAAEPDLTKRAAMFDAQSFVPRMNRGNLPGASIVLERGDGRARVILTLPRSGRGQLAQALRTREVAVAMTVGPDPAADAIFVWGPGTPSHSRAISAGASSGRRVSGNFVALSNASHEDIVKPMEDGFGVALTPATWAKLVDAVVAGRSIEVSSQPIALSVAWANR